MTARWCVLLLLLYTGAAAAHRPSDAYVTLDVVGNVVTGRIEIALRDLPLVTPVDANGDRQLSWGEVRNADKALSLALRAALQITADGQPCPLRNDALLINERGDGPYVWLSVAAQCAAVIETLSVRYGLLFDVDPTHRGVLVLSAGTQTHTALFAPASASQSFKLDNASLWKTFTDYVAEGVRHIWLGYDHILFLLAMLVPAVLIYRSGGWHPANSLRRVLTETLLIVTAFTLAHSLTLAIAVLDWIRLPGALVESFIAASVILAALNNILPLVRRHRWLMAFVFGLIHGFGFAAVLAELGLPDNLRLTALLAFNVGVELGQAAIVLVAVPLAYAVRATPFYIRGVRVVGSLAAVVLALWWFLDRSGLL